MSVLYVHCIVLDISYRLSFSPVVPQVRSACIVFVLCAGEQFVGESYSRRKYHQRFLISNARRVALYIFSPRENQHHRRRRFWSRAYEGLGG